MPLALPTASRKQRRLLTLRSKILLAFLAMAAVSAGLGSYAVGSMAMAGRLTAEIFDSALTSISYARAAATDYAMLEALLAGHTGRPASPAGSDRAKELREQLEMDLSIAASRSHAPRAQAAAARVRTAIAACERTRHNAGQAPGGAADNAIAACSADVAEQLDVLVNLTAGQGFHDRESALAQVASGRRLTMLTTFGAVMLSALITWLLSRRLIGPIAAASAAAERIARGELDTPIPDGAADELGNLLRAMAIMRDNIRDRIAAEVAQRRSAQMRLLDAIENSDSGMMLVDEQGQIVMTNSQNGRFQSDLAKRMKPGMSFPTALRTAVQYGLVASDDPSFAERLAAAPGTGLAPPPGTVFVGEARLPNNRWIRVSRSATRDGGYTVITNDITTLKWREQELQQSKLYLDAALDNMVQGLCLFDANDKLRVVNRRFCQIYGLRSEQISTGTDFADIMRAIADAGNYNEGETCA
jgi:PAS domain-containing protein